VKIFFQLGLCLYLAASIDARAELYRPYSQSNTERIEFHEGYCENKNQENKLLQAVNKTAKSIIDVLPTLPPEQINYIETEQDSKNADRIIAIGDTSIYKMYRMRININNIKVLSNLYLENHKKLKIEKKIEIVGKLLLNINELDDYKKFDKAYFQKSLESRNYIISDAALDELQIGLISLNFIRKNLIYHLICYGEKSK
jgi:hypothetical protein